VTWQPYLKKTTAAAPFLLARLVSPGDRLARAIYLDAMLDTGSALSCVPGRAIEECRRTGIPLVKGAGVRAAGAFDRGRASRETYKFQLTVCAAPAARASLAGGSLRAQFSAGHVLYPTPDVELGAHVRSIEMPVTERSYVVLGRDVLAHWTVILHGRSSRFKVMDRGGKWFIFSLAPR
jgi:hypothetical protein